MKGNTLLKNKDSGKQCWKQTLEISVGICGLCRGLDWAESTPYKLVSFFDIIFCMPLRADMSGTQNISNTSLILKY